MTAPLKTNDEEGVDARPGCLQVVPGEIDLGFRHATEIEP
jgi:hypothetical protein